MMISGLSNNIDSGGRTGLAEYNSKGDFIATHWLPTDDDLRGAVKTGKLADGYGYDIRVSPRRNIMLTSSFTGWSNYMMDIGQMIQDPEAMKRFGHTMVLWDLQTR
jgi:selenium-binding protein 1